jgi:hypothetical protein
MDIQMDEKLISLLDCFTHEPQIQSPKITLPERIKGVAKCRTQHDWSRQNQKQKKKKKEMVGKEHNVKRESWKLYRPRTTMPTGTCTLFLNRHAILYLVIRRHRRLRSSLS